MTNKVLGGILLIVGTSIGGGMLALPVATTGGGFIGSSLLLLACWLVMTLSAFLILEVNLWLPATSNMVSMAGATLGPVGQVGTWLTYLILHYCLLSAYIAGGTDVLHDLLALMGVATPLWIASILFVFILGFVVCKGVRSIDYVNRGLMSVKILTYLVLVACILPFIHVPNLTIGHPPLLLGTVTVIITSYGFAAIVPSLRIYYQDNIKQLRKVILIGSLIPLFCYLLWDLSIIGTVPREKLLEMLRSGHSTSDLTHALSVQLNNSWITNITRIFTSLCVATSFLGVSLCLSDFLADGLKLSKAGLAGWWVYLLTFIPPLAVILFYPNAFIKGLSYAGIFCTILLILLPVMMVWRGRYHKQLAVTIPKWSGKPMLIVVAAIALVIIGLGIAENLQLLKLTT